MIEQEAAEKAAAYGDAARVHIQVYCRLLAPMERYQCIRESIDSARQRQHDERDLEAQLVTSVWTHYMGLAAIGGTAFGIIGVFLVLATFRETRRAVEAGISAERPHVRFHRTIKDTKWNGEIRRLKGVNFINFGRTPALVKRLDIDFRLAVNPPDPEEARNSPVTMRSFAEDMVIAQGEEWPRGSHIGGWDKADKAEDLHKLLAADGRGLFVFGILSYEDAFGRTLETRFCREFDGLNFTYNQTDIGSNKRLNSAD